MSGLVAYPFLLRPGTWVYLRLPSDLDRRDVERLKTALMALVVDDEQQEEKEKVNA